MKRLLNSRKSELAGISMFAATIV